VRRKKESSFSEEKEAKRLLFVLPRGQNREGNKSFLVLFFKKEHLP
jgi:hypothetical protein